MGRALYGLLGMAFGVALVVGGLLSYRALGGAPAAVAPAEALGLRGDVMVRAYHADGTLYRTWEGHNALTPIARNAIAACATGISTAPKFFGACSPLINAIALRGGTPVSFQVAIKAATNTLLPPGCVPTTGIPLCNGWRTEATFDAEITVAADINNIQGRLETPPVSSVAFDDIGVSPAIHVDPGDRLFVTINFSIP